MKRERGRPRGKVYPQPDDLLDGYWIAKLGKLGASEAMRVILVCLYADFTKLQTRPPRIYVDRDGLLCERSNFDQRQTRPPRNRTGEDEESHWAAFKHLNHWNHEIGTVIRQRIFAGDHEFFRQLADALEKVALKDEPEMGKDRRFLALAYKFFCDVCGDPFTFKGFRSFYKHYVPKPDIDPSTLSKIHRWAKSAKWRGIPKTLAPLIREAARK